MPAMLEGPAADGTGGAAVTLAVSCMLGWAGRAEGVGTATGALLAEAGLVSLTGDASGSSEGGKGMGYRLRADSHEMLHSQSSALLAPCSISPESDSNRASTASSE